MSSSRILFSAIACCCAIAVAGCGGDDETPVPPPVNEEEIAAALNTITKTCIKVSFGQGGATADSDVSLAVDDLLRNFEANPDAPLDLHGGYKAESPREALEGALPFLEDGKCSPDDAQRIHEALASTPVSAEEATGATGETTAVDPDAEQTIRDTAEAFQAEIAQEDYEGACDYLSPGQARAQTFGGECTLKYAGLNWVTQGDITDITVEAETKGHVELPGGTLVMTNTADRVGRGPDERRLFELARP